MSKKMTAGWVERSDIHPARFQKGFTLIELVVVIAIVVFLAATFLNRVWFYQEQAEKTAMVEVVGALQSALVLQYGHLVIHDVKSDIAALATDNPMNWLAKVPRNYAGEFYDPIPDSITPGNWAFDSKARELIYVLNRAEYFVPGNDGNKWIRYRVNLKYESDPGAPGAESKLLVGALFEPDEPYRWFD